jgi:hypothetical protein
MFSTLHDGGMGGIGKSSAEEVLENFNKKKCQKEKTFTQRYERVQH